MAITNKAVHDWVQKSQHGDELVYSKPGRRSSETIFETFRKLSEGGLVFLYQRRIPWGTGTSFEHVARRTPPAAHETLDWVSRATNLKGQYVPRLRVDNPFRPEEDSQ